MQILSDEQKVGSQIDTFYHVGAFGPYNSDDCCVSERLPDGTFSYTALHRDKWLRFNTYAGAERFIASLDPRNGTDYQMFEFTIWEMAEFEVTVIGTKLMKREQVNFCRLD